MAGVAEDRQQALQEAEGGEVVEVSSHAGRAPGCGRHVRLAADPGDQALRGGLVAREGRVPVSAQRRRERGRGSGHLSEPALHQGVNALV